MILKVHLKVKFRAFFVDLAKFEQSWTFPLQLPPVGFNQHLVQFNKQGVLLEVDIVPAAFDEG